jgi:protein-S-isoprenylcysteine O-methyltransferase Ste14
MQDKLIDLNDWLFYDISCPGPRIPPRYIINAFKGSMLPFCLALILLYGNSSFRATLYTGLHGSYGIIWILKDYIFGDKNFATPATIASNVFIGIGLCLYQIIAFLAISGERPEIGMARAFMAILSYAVGLFLMIGSDAQKYWTLKFRPGLINDGFFRSTRNPNYLGEVLIYLAFGITAQSYIAYGILLTFWLAVFVPRMLGKDRSLARKKEFPIYASTSGLFFPKFLADPLADRALWGTAVALLASLILIL